MNLAFLNHALESLTAMSKENPVVAGAVSLWGLSVITLLVRGIPMRIWSFVKRQSTTSLTVLSSDAIYYDLLRWLSQEKMNSWTRTFSFGRGQMYSWNAKSIMAIGYGSQFFWLGNRLMTFRRSQVEANATAESKEVVTITVLGRSRKVFEKLFETIKDKDEKKLYTNIMVYKDGWVRLGKQYKRPLNTVTIPQESRDKLVAHLEEFMSRKQWFIDNGIPWRTGILLSGPPGTGKTSLIKALCAHLGSDLYLLDISSMSNTSLRNALSSVPEGAIVAIEDIDAANIGKARNLETKNVGPTSLVRELTSEGPKRIALADTSPSTDPLDSMLTLSGVLNAIDGPASGEGRILIATSNAPDTLDAALTREGRFDLKMKIDYMAQPEFEAYMKRFFPDLDLGTWRIKGSIAPCKVQAVTFENLKDPTAVLRQVAEEV